MKKLICGTLLFGLLSLAAGQAMAEPMYGVLMVVKGSVKVQTADKQTDAKVGGRVHEGDTLITGPDSRAKVVMSDRNVINVNPDTQVAIAKYVNDPASGTKNVELNLLKGKVRNNVEQTYDGEKNKFLIKTPTAVAGVRGTQFLAGFDAATRMTSVVTFKGSVTLASVGPKGNIIGTPVTINKGQMTQTAPNTAPETPKAVPKEEIKKMDGESTASMQNKENKEASASGGEQKREAASEGSSSSDKSAKKETASMVDSADMNPNQAKEIKPTMPPPPEKPKQPGTQPTPSQQSDVVKDIKRDAKIGPAKVIVKPVISP